jgi:protein-tyrosine-phosphatase
MEVLFICEGNMTRSQMAEAFYNMQTQSHDAISAGTIATGMEHIGSRAAEVMSEIGIATDEQHSKQLTPEMVDKADVVILFPANETPDYVKSSPKTRFWDVSDPHYYHSEGMPFVQRVRDEIRDKVETLVEEIAREHRD